MFSEGGGGGARGRYNWQVDRHLCGSNEREREKVKRVNKIHPIKETFSAKYNGLVRLKAVNADRGDAKHSEL